MKIYYYVIILSYAVIKPNIILIIIKYSNIFFSLMENYLFIPIHTITSYRSFVKK